MLLSNLMKLMFASISTLQATEDRYRNKGAYIILEPPDFDTPIFCSFDAVTPRPKVSSSSRSELA